MDLCHVLDVRALLRAELLRHQREVAGVGEVALPGLVAKTQHLGGADVLRFRDQAWQRYFTDPSYLALVATKFGAQERSNIEHMATIHLKRRLLGD